ncbi:ABC transporter permease [Shewanella psychrotolerans]|uniref:ABC transporter permease n=1 Tax=Shewanella psychrotolerans TaxID=2864206 RepID=UPI001C65B2E3|nr:ABC transporter permease [Shewanella psychrotolerans]QYK03044.1 ABC transporter permease [Shewanella psychrotolerans]
MSKSAEVLQQPSVAVPEKTEEMIDKKTSRYQAGSEKAWLRYLWPVAALVLLLVVNLFIDSSFFHLTFQDDRFYGSLIDILNRAAPVALLAIGMSLVIATGGIDLSVGAVMAIAGAACANLLLVPDLSVFTVVIIGLLVGILAGCVNGGLVAYLGIQPIVATLLLMVAGRGIAQLINQGQIVTFQSPGFAAIGTGQWLGLPMPIWIVIAMLIATQLLLRKTALGLFIEAVGCNAKASRYMGINDKSIKLFVYAVAGLCAALAGMISAADIQGSDANNAGLWLELDAILAVVIGGAALTGGRFSLILSIVGALIIQTLATTIIVSGLPAKFNLLIKAVVILLVLLLQSELFRNQLKALFSFFKNVSSSEKGSAK